MLNEKDEPSRYHRETTFYPKRPLAAKLESTACGPAGEFTDRDHVCQHDLPTMEKSPLAPHSDSTGQTTCSEYDTFFSASYAIIAADDV